MRLQAGNKTLDLDGIEAFVFDLDGTLVESEHVWRKAKILVSRRYGRSPDDAELGRFEGRSVADFVQEYLGLEQDPEHSEAIDQIIGLSLRALDTDLREIPGASRLVESVYAAGFRVAICSSAPLEAIQKSTRRLGISHMVGVTFSASGLIHGKPDKRPYEETLKRLALKPGQALSFEDSLSGVLASTAAGIKTVFLGNSPDIEAIQGVVARCASVDEVRLLY